MLLAGVWALGTACKGGTTSSTAINPIHLPIILNASAKLENQLNANASVYGIFIFLYQGITFSVLGIVSWLQNLIRATHTFDSRTGNTVSISIYIVI